MPDGVTSIVSYDQKQLEKENKLRLAHIEKIKQEVAGYFDNIANPEPFILSPAPAEATAPVYEQVA